MDLCVWAYEGGSAREPAFPPLCVAIGKGTWGSLCCMWLRFFLMLLLFGCFGFVFPGVPSTFFSYDYLFFFFFPGPPSSP